MKTFSYTITDPAGLHVRLAGAFVKLAKQFRCITTATKEDKTVEVNSVFHLMSLGTQYGQTLTVTTSGEQEEEAAAAMREFLLQNV